jgi:hypothetical protein
MYGQGNNIPKSMIDWTTVLKKDPVPCLMQVPDEAITYFTGRDLQDWEVLPLISLWELPAVQKILRTQREDGSWTYPGKSKEKYPHVNYALLETYRTLGILIEKFGFNRTHPAIIRAAEYCFSCQREEGDFRGIYGNQYSPNYSAAIMELLIKAGYSDDARVERGFRWLLSVRQADGGWAIPIRTHGVGNTIQWFTEHDSAEPLHSDTSKSFSHMVTGIVLRAFAAHPRYCTSEHARRAGELVASRFFMNDTYVDRKSKTYWEKTSFPFWFTDIVSALDSLSWLQCSKEHPQMEKGLNWLKTRQTEEGLFDLKMLRAGKKSLVKYWVTLAICRIFKRMYW